MVWLTFAESLENSAEKCFERGMLCYSDTAFFCQPPAPTKADSQDLPQDC